MQQQRNHGLAFLLLQLVERLQGFHGVDRIHMVGGGVGYCRRNRPQDRRRAPRRHIKIKRRRRELREPRHEGRAEDVGEPRRLLRADDVRERRRLLRRLDLARRALFLELFWRSVADCARSPRRRGRMRTGRPSCRLRATSPPRPCNRTLPRWGPRRSMPRRMSSSRCGNCCRRGSAGRRDQKGEWRVAKTSSEWRIGNRE